MSFIKRLCIPSLCNRYTNTTCFGSRLKSFCPNDSIRGNPTTNHLIPMLMSLSRWVAGIYLPPLTLLHPSLLTNDISYHKRGCLGSKFAQVEGTIALSMLARAYKIELPSGCTDRSFIFAKTTLLTTQAKNEIRMVLKKREMERGESCRVSSQLF